MKIFLPSPSWKIFTLINTNSTNFRIIYSSLHFWLFSNTHNKIITIIIETYLKILLQIIKM